MKISAGKVELLTITFNPAFLVIAFESFVLAVLILLLLMLWLSFYFLFLGSARLWITAGMAPVQRFALRPPLGFGFPVVTGHSVFNVLLLFDCR